MSDKENLSVINQFRSTPSHRDYFQKQMDNFGISFSEFALGACLNAEIVINESAGVSYFDGDVVYELNKIGVNLMQYLKKFHSTGHPPPPDFAVTVDEHRALLQKILTILKA